MTHHMNVPRVGATTPGLPHAASKLNQIDHDIAAIKTQLAAADLRRQAQGRAIDPDWYHKAKTALRHLQAERGQLQDAKRFAKQAFKDQLIAVLRESSTQADWQAALAEARKRAGKEAHHG